MKKGILLLSLLSLYCNLTFGQISGNQVYSRGNHYSDSKRENGFIGVKATDSTIIISSRVLYNLKPDYCIVTIGLNQESPTLSECLSELNKRIKGVVSKLGTIGVKKEDYYIDFISQTKIYDYSVDIKASTGEEKFTGLEVKKNLIVKISDLNHFEKLVEIAAEVGAYDIVKVDYRNTDLESIYSKLFNQCSEIIEKKKALYFGDKINVKKSGVISDNFYSVEPNERYNSYQAYESSGLEIYRNNHSSDFVKKEERKAKTYFYNGVAPSGFDKIINMEVPTVGTQYILELSIKYETK